MPLRLDEMDSANNREAEGTTFTRRKADMSSAFARPEANTRAIDLETPKAEEAEGAEPGFPLTEDQLIRLVKSAFNQGKSYQEQVLQPRWLSAYNAFNNKHSSDSKYSSARFRGRSRLFRPKTRATARKKQAEAAAAMFSTSNALLVRAADESNPQQLAGAELLNELLRFRLDRANENSGIPWFQISMGAHLCAQQTGICISKQYWEYRRELEGYEPVPIEQPIPPEMQQLVGMPSVTVGETLQPKYRTVRDRPRVELLAPEDVIRDPAAAWENQAQESAYLILRFPMTLEAARTFLRQSSDKSRVKFLEISDETLAAAAGGAGDPNNAANIRRARESNGTDRFSDYAIDSAYQQVWLHENYFRVEGQDYCFWTLGADRLISEVIPVEEAYPEQNGARPVVIGVGALEPFKIDPMAPVESWQELQREINDIVNLRLDTLKQTIAPLAKVRRGRSVDIRAIQNRTPDTVVYMQDMGDVEFDRPGNVASESYIEMEKLNADFDDQAGNFSTGSVQTNRQLGETVGGMQMMMSNANALGEFDLRVWIETWVEPVLRQLVKLEQFYESDDNVIAISAKRAKLMPRFGISTVTDDMLNTQVAISVDVGIGSSDPMISLQKFQQAGQIALGLLGQGAQMRLKQDAVIDEIFGKAGYKDASERFFQPSDEQDPRIQQMQQALQQMQDQMQQMAQQLADKKAEQETRVQIARLNAVAGLAKQEMSQQHQQKTAFVNAAMSQVAADQERQFTAEQGDQQHARAMEMQQAKQPPMGGMNASMGGGPGPSGGMMGAEPEDMGEARMEGGQEEPGQPQSIHQLLGLAPPADPGQQIQPLVMTMMQGFRMIAQQMQNQNAELAGQLSAQQRQTVDAIMASNEDSQRQNMLITRQIAAQQQQTLEAVQQGNEQIMTAMMAPKRVIRGPDGFAQGVVIDLPQNQQE